MTNSFHFEVNAMKMSSTLIVMVHLGIFSLSVKAQALFNENFEGNLSQWTGKNGGTHNGVIVADPLRTNNDVLKFSALENGGDMFSNEITFPVGEAITIRFEYLGLSLPESVADDFGGFLGISDMTDSLNDGVDSRWLAGTDESYGNNIYVIEEHLIDDDRWHSYEITIPNPFPSFHIMLEDWITSGGVPGDAFFDNISVTPEPSTLLLLSAASMIALCQRRRRGL